MRWGPGAPGCHTPRCAGQAAGKKRRSRGRAVRRRLRNERRPTGRRDRTLSDVGAWRSSFRSSRDEGESRHASGDVCQRPSAKDAASTTRSKRYLARPSALSPRPRSRPTAMPRHDTTAHHAARLTTWHGSPRGTALHTTTRHGTPRRTVRCVTPRRDRRYCGERHRPVILLPWRRQATRSARGETASCSRG